MTIVVDSNVILAIALNLPFSQTAVSLYHEWLKNNEQILAPTLFEYETTSVIRQNVRAGLLSEEAGHERLDFIAKSNVQIVPPDIKLHHAALDWASRLGQSKAYDAHYLALAEREHAQFYSADKRLVNAILHLGYDWVHKVAPD